MESDPTLLAPRSPRQEHLPNVPVPPDRFELSIMGGVLIVQPLGAFDHTSMRSLDQLLDVVDTPVVVNLHHSEPGDASAFLHHELSRREQFPPGHVSVVCARGDSPPERSEVDYHFPVFRQAADAVQALVLAESGYGDGWS